MEYATEVRNLLVNPPEENPYEKLKEKTISRVADSERQKIRQLLTAEELGDCKPTKLVRKMQQLLVEKSHRQFTFVRTIFATAPS